MALFGTALLAGSIAIYFIDPRRDPFVLAMFWPAAIAALSIAYAIARQPNWRAGYTKTLLLLAGLTTMIRLIVVPSGASVLDAAVGAFVMLFAIAFPLGVVMDWLALAAWAARSRSGFGRRPR